MNDITQLRLLDTGFDYQSAVQSTVKQTAIHNNSAPQVLLFLTTDPLSVKKRLLRFRNAFTKLGPNHEFAIASYLPNTTTEIRKLVIGGIEIKHYVFSLDAIRTLGYPNKGAAKEFRLIPGNSDLVTLLFRRLNPQYSQYWLVEDDVEYSGDLAQLFSDLNRKPGDLLATHLARGYEGWAYASHLVTPQNIQPDDSWLIFLPIFRITAQALDTIEMYYQGGWSGHNENTWATILKLAGLQIVDIGGDGEFVAEEDRNRFYYGLPNQGYDKLGSFGTMQIRLFKGRRKNVLWHPIKRPSVWVKQNYKRIKSMLKWKLARFGR
jgi:hypothetical protein